MTKAIMVDAIVSKGTSGDRLRVESVGLIGPIGMEDEGMPLEHQVTMLLVRGHVDGWQEGESNLDGDLLIVPRFLTSPFHSVCCVNDSPNNTASPINSPTLS